MCIVGICRKKILINIVFMLYKPEAACISTGRVSLYIIHDEDEGIENAEFI